MPSLFQGGLSFLAEFLAGRARKGREAFQKSTSSDTMLIRSTAGGEVTRQVALDLMKNLDAGAPLAKIKEKLEKHSMTTDILRERNARGYNMLQKAVILGRPDLVTYLISMGANVESKGCCPPLHLACKLGRLDVLHVLLAQGVDVTRPAAICFPARMNAAGLDVSKSAPSDHHKTRGVGVSRTCHSDIQMSDSLTCALTGDNVDVVRCILGTPGIDLPEDYEGNLLHMACTGGHVDCIRYLVEERGLDGIINIAGWDGWTPLHHCVTWGYTLTSYVMDHSGDVRVKTDRQETCLHLLYRTCIIFSEVSRLTRLLLSTGLTDDVNDLDCNGYSALHCLLAMLDRAPCSYGQPGQAQGNNFQYDSERNFNDSQSPSSREVSLDTDKMAAGSRPSNDSASCYKSPCFVPGAREVADALNLLLQGGADRTCRTPSGVHPVHLAITSARSYPDLYHILQVLLHHGTPMDDSTVPEDDAVVLVLLSKFSFVRPPHCVLYACDHQHYADRAGWLVTILDLLNRHGHRIAPSKSPLIWQELMRAFEKVTDPWLPISGQWPRTLGTTGEDTFMVYVRSFLDVLKELFRMGLDPNALFDYTCWVVYPFHAVYMSLVLKNKLALGVGMVHYVLKTLLQHGADPNLGTLPVLFLSPKYQLQGETAEERHTPLLNLLTLLQDSYPSTCFYRQGLLTTARMLVSVMDYDLVQQSFRTVLSPICYNSSKENLAETDADRMLNTLCDPDIKIDAALDATYVTKALYMSTRRLWVICQQRIYSSIGFRMADIYKLPLPKVIQDDMFSLGGVLDI